MSIQKKRFGVSVPMDLAVQLDELADKLGVDRSSLVVEALRTYIHDHMHILKPHKCMGVMISTGIIKDLGKIIENYRDIIIAYNHYHVDGKCIVTMIVSGDSSRIQSLSADLLSRKCMVRYIPLKNLY